MSAYKLIFLTLFIWSTTQSNINTNTNDISHDPLDNIFSTAISEDPITTPEEETLAVPQEKDQTAEIYNLQAVLLGTITNLLKTTDNKSLLSHNVALAFENEANAILNQVFNAEEQVPEGFSTNDSDVLEVTLPQIQEIEHVLKYADQLVDDSTREIEALLEQNTFFQNLVSKLSELSDDIDNQDLDFNISEIPQITEPKHGDEDLSVIEDKLLHDLIMPMVLEAVKGLEVESYSANEDPLDLAFDPLTISRPVQGSALSIVQNVVNSGYQGQGLLDGEEVTHAEIDLMSTDLDSRGSISNEVQTALWVFVLVISIGLLVVGARSLRKNETAEEEGTNYVEIGSI